MKKIFYIALCAMFFASCSDKVYQELNTDPTKSVNPTNPSYQLTYAELQIYGDMNYVDVHRLYTYAFTQHLMGCWNTTNYGGDLREDDSEMGRPWNNLYPAAFRNLTDAIYQTDGNPDQANNNAALRIFRVYVGSLLTDFYGDVPFTEAGLGYLQGTTQPKYDKQEDLYRLFFAELDSAANMFSGKAKPIESDPMFGGDTELWRVFANSLRLRFAMRLSEVDEEWAKAEFNKALEAGVMTSAAYDACVKHLNIAYSFGQEAYKDFRGNALAKYFFGNDPSNNPTYICKTFWDQLYNTNDPRLNRLFRFYIDDFMSISDGSGRIDLTEEIMEGQADGRNLVSTVAPGEFSWNDWPSYIPRSGSSLDKKLAEVVENHPDYDLNEDTRWLKAKLANNFLRSDNPGVIMTYAEVCFLCAEAAARGWIDKEPNGFYEDGIRESMDFLSRYYGCEPVSDEELEEFMIHNDVMLTGDKEDRIRLINTQAWILHFHNPAEAWANVRRTHYPERPKPIGGGDHPIMDNTGEIPLRLCYPIKEGTYSRTAYEEAKARVEGGYNWHAPVWWDRKSE